MDGLKHYMFFATTAWLLQMNNTNMLAAAIAVSNKAKPVWLWKPLKQLGPI